MTKAPPPENPCRPGSKIIGGSYDYVSHQVRMHVLTPSGKEVIVRGLVEEK